jgi:hypothetical protein
MTTMRIVTIGLLVGLLGGAAAAQEQPPYPYPPYPNDPYANPGDTPYPDQGADAEAYAQFESTLAPYGQWVTDPVYGPIWVPAPTVVGTDFWPYATGGYWGASAYGWTWVSDWDWGWAPFHYGLWVNLAPHGWCWVPGHVWGPGWVSWHNNGAAVAWSPLVPGAAVRDHRVVYPGWHSAPNGQLGHPRTAYYPTRAVPPAVNHTQIVRSAPVRFMGPPVRYNAPPGVEVRTHFHGGRHR